MVNYGVMRSRRAGSVTGRSFQEHETQRWDTLHTIESYLTRMAGLNGHACVLRTICEAAQTPYHTDGLMGEAINVLLVPAHVLQHLPPFGEADYVTAQRKGQFGQDCSDYHAACPTSFFRVEDDSQHYYQDYYTNFNNYTSNHV